MARTTVTTDMLKDLAVATAKLADLAVTTAKLAAGSVTSAKLAQGAPITLAAQQVTTSGTVFDFAVPAGVKRITVMFKGVSISGTDNLLVQLGDAGGFETSGYLSESGGMNNGAGSSVATSTAGFISQAGGAGGVVSGTMTLSLMDAATFSWVSAHNTRQSSTLTSAGSGEKALSAELTQVRVTRTGTDTFDAGAIGLSYE